MQTLHLSRGEVYFTYVVKFRPTKTNERTGRLNNRPPTREEVLLCRPYLYDEIALVAPRLIVALGNAALRAVSGEEKAMIGQWHRRNVGAGGCAVPYMPCTIQLAWCTIPGSGKPTNGTPGPWPRWSMENPWHNSPLTSL